jgi:hypothetical protein
LTCAGDELWQEFKKYRVSIVNDPTLSSQYFSKSVNEEWLSSIFSPRESGDDVLAALGAIKSRALFGRRISSIYYVKEERKMDNSAELTLVYKTPKNSGPYTYVVTYSNESGVWLISKTLNDITKPTVQLPASPIYEFKLGS